MATRRVASSMRLTSPERSTPWTASSLSASGATMWFEIMVESAMVETMTMEVAALRPPMKMKVASASRPKWSGRSSMKRSGFDPSGSAAPPTAAKGSTKSDISSM